MNYSLGSEKEVPHELHLPESLQNAYTAALGHVESEKLVARMAAKDPTIWRDDPREITNRLGWLDVPLAMTEHIDALRAYADELGRRGVRDIVLLGMGGSSLAAETLRRILGRRYSDITFQVLDSTSPAWIRRVTSTVDPSHLHVLVASKSGTTIEVLKLYAYFEKIATQGDGPVGERFTALTDPGTPLAAMAQEKGFLRCWENPPDIGGRFSALAYYGLVPAQLMSVEMSAYLRDGCNARAACGPETPIAENPGAVLGAYLAAGAKLGRDKLTLLLSRQLDGFGLWVEQLVAESTGKDGTGILPVDGEVLPLRAPLGDDRLFVAYRLEGDNNDNVDRLVEDLVARGQPVAVRTFDTPRQASSEMYRWEVATALVAHFLGVHPFDQPDVQAAKTATGKVLDALTSGKAAPSPPAEDAAALLANLQEGEYVSVMIFGDLNPRLATAIRGLRGEILARSGNATTLGLGPRFLHSTGQLHKGGANCGIFLQMVLDEGELAIPGCEYGFHDLIRAQADGDYAALKGAGRRVVRLDPGNDAAAVIDALAAGVRAGRG